MGGAASKDFIANAPRTAVAKELDELGGYDRPALARNQSFAARLDWLGTQVGKASEQIEAALSKDEQAGRRELEKEAKRRQLMALRRGQGDIQLNSQYADFYLKQKQFERPPLGAAPILRNAAAVAADAAAAVALAEQTSPQGEAARRSLEKVATLQRLYSKHAATSFKAPGPKPPHESGAAVEPSGAAAVVGGGGNTNSRWRQTVQHAKKTAFLAVGSYVAMNGKKRNGPARIDNFGLYAEQQLGDGMHKFVEEGERLAAARDKLPAMKAELEKLRGDMRELAVEQEAVLAVDGVEDSSSDEGPDAEGACDDDALEADEAAAVAGAAAAAMRHPQQQQAGSNRPAWHFGGGGGGHGGGGFGAPPSLTAKKPRPSPPPRQRAEFPAAASSTSAPAGRSVSTPPATAPLPIASPAGPAPVVPHNRRRASIGSPQQLTQSANWPVLMATTAPPGAAAPTPVVSVSPGRGLSPSGPGSTSRAMRASWSGAATGGSDLLGSRAAAAAAVAAVSASGTCGGSEPAAHPPSSTLSGQACGALRPSRPAASLLSRLLGPAAAAQPQSKSSPPAVPGPAVGGSGAGPPAAATQPSPPRPKSAMRSALSPRPPSVGPNGKRRVVRVGEPPRAAGVGSADTATTSTGEYRIGTMAQRVSSKVGLPLKAAAKQQLRTLRKAETVNVLRQQQLVQAIEENASVLQTASGLLNMYCNRANGRWVEQQQWTLPPVHEAAMPAVRRQAERYKELVLKDLREGRVAVQIHVDDDTFSSSRLGLVSLWSTDPWHLLSMTHPARTESTAHLVGLGMGVRQLLALGTAVESLVGAEAVAKMPVVLACHEGQVEEVVRDLAARKMCRFSSENVIIIVQQRTPGHAYNRAKHAFVPAPEAPPRPAGSGYALLALGWAGADAFRLTGPELSQRTPLERSTLDMFTERGVQWLSSWRLRDLVHYSPEQCLNLEQLALSYALADSMDANMSMQVELVDSLQGINRIGSGIVLAQKGRPAPLPSPTLGTSNSPLLRRTNDPASPASPPSAATAGLRQPHSPRSPHTLGPLRHPYSAPPATFGSGSPGSGLSPRTPLGGLSTAGASPTRRPVTSAGARAGGIGSEGGPLAACDVKWADVQTPALASAMQHLVESVAVQSGSQPRLAVSIKRYTYHVPSLKSILTGPSIFRPCISVGEGGYVYVTFDASDITAQPSTRCVALSYTPRPCTTADNSASSSSSTAAAAPTNASLPSPASITGVPTIASPPPTLEAAGGRPGSAIRLCNGHTLATGALGSSAAASAAMASASIAAAALQRGRLLTNDSDLETLLWVASDQDNNAAFRAAVSATNTARSRVTAHAPAGLAAAVGAGGPGGRSVEQHVIVLAVADDAACQLAVRVAMAIMKPGADCLHVLAIAKDPSVMALSAARALAERFENLASATLGDVKSVVQVKRHSVVEDIVGYAEAVGAALLVTGSMNLAAAAAGGTSVVGSVALSVARECNRPILVVKPTARLAESAYEVGKKPCLRAAVCAEPSCRPLVRFLVTRVLDGGRGDKLVLVRGKAFDKEMNELTSSRRVLDHLAEEATSHRRFDSSQVVRRMVAGAFEAEHPRVVDADHCHIVALQVPDGRGPLPPSVLNLLRTSRSAVLLYRNCSNSSAAKPGGET